MAEQTLDVEQAVLALARVTVDASAHDRLALLALASALPGLVQDARLAQVLRLASPFDLPCAEVAWNAERDRWDIDWTIGRAAALSVEMERDGNIVWAALLGGDSRHGQSSNDPDPLAKLTDALRVLAMFPAASQAEETRPKLRRVHPHTPGDTQTVYEMSKLFSPSDRTAQETKADG